MVWYSPFLMHIGKILLGLGYTEKSTIADYNLLKVDHSFRFDNVHLLATILSYYARLCNNNFSTIEGNQTINKKWSNNSEVQSVDGILSTKIISSIISILIYLKIHE